MNWTTIIVILILLVVADKALTLINIKLVEKNSPGSDPISIEKNPMAKKFFQMFGLYGGTVAYAVIGFLTLLLAMYTLHFATSIWAPDNAYGMALYILVLVYSLVIGNNVYFMIRFAGWLQ